MLKDQLYTIQNIDYQDFVLKAEIKLIKTNPIFKGHFPDVPVLPGVTMMQMVKELLEIAEEKKFLIQSAGQIKFLQMLNPEHLDVVNWEINVGKTEERLFKVKAQMIKEDIVFFKMTGKLEWQQ
ncbi:MULTISPECIES: hydroxymyristoyl-ACP dehydratase [unclassified Lentimicrobium]|uniref:hydroxymyristoyl-ACP dehydratase n=1 Tax=unclassified Lentimicrobium TaxID=2677434 RepID=UPI00155585FE|nr:MULTISPECIES: hydroxymyristoyl-ACP dehydratase [unclassified Lentimicrobium]NPD45284.1 hydroxymyristoyl-ACP dehydratase [Lentimicrobium sp. S6]NPD84416.1 hydroxymyristoyl-ACP dehydratase [Lentimicrobium sp. L6]